jgi:hypothetical protein
MTTKTDERCLSDPRFWEMFFSLFCDENKLIEFSEVSGIPADHIRTARRKYLSASLDRLNAHYHESGTVH